MKKYEPLRRLLRRSRHAAVDLSFAELETTLGAMLPKAAASPDWWSNEPLAPPRRDQRNAWLEAGFDAELLSHERVRFARRTRGNSEGGDAASEGSQAVL